MILRIAGELPQAEIETRMERYGFLLYQTEWIDERRNEEAGIRSATLHIVGEYDKGHWIEGGEKGLEFRREVYAFNRFKRFADALRLIVVPKLTHYGHVESYNERLASLMVTGFKDYFRN